MKHYLNDSKFNGSSNYVQQTSTTSKQRTLLVQKSNTKKKKLFNEDEFNPISDVLHGYLKTPFSFLYDYKLLPKKSSVAFKQNLYLSLRIAFGVLIAGMIQTRNDEGSDKMWLLLPSYYYLGGLIYAAAGVIFAAGRNLGQALEGSWQAFCGVSIALVFNSILFRSIPPTQTDLYETSLTITGESYFVSQRDVAIYVPFLLVFTFIVILLPMQISTKKFAIGMNVYFVLTIINPMDPLETSPPRLKVINDSRYTIDNIIANFGIYIMVGVVGSFIGIITMLLPYPILAIIQLKKESRRMKADVDDAMNVLIDGFCFKRRSTAQNKSLQLKFKRIFNGIKSRFENIQNLLNDVWWEQAIGLHKTFDLNKGAHTQYNRLSGTLVSSLRGMRNAMCMDKDEMLHEESLRSIREDIYKVQLNASTVLDEISRAVQKSATVVQVTSVAALQESMNKLLSSYKIAQQNMFQNAKYASNDMYAVRSTIAMKLFIFNLISFGETLVDFETKFNAKNYAEKYRMKNFLKRAVQVYVLRDSYNKAQVLSAFKVTLAIAIAMVPAIYVYGFSSTAPASIAYVMGNYLGGSYVRTSNRVVGVVGGSIVPSLMKFFICNISSVLVQNIASNAVLFVWVTMSMQVFFSGSQLQYSGTVSAFIAASILLERCGGTNSIAGTNGSLIQTSMGMMIFIAVEMLIAPRSAITLLRYNIQESLSSLQTAFQYYYTHHEVDDDTLDDATIARARKLVLITIPELLKDQQGLLQEASVEPILWRPAFSVPKYQRILCEQYSLLNNVSLLRNVFRWKLRRATKQASVKVENSTVFVDTEFAMDSTWDYSNDALEAVMMDSFSTLIGLYGEKHFFSRTDDTAIYLQMKQAFRLADKDGNGVIDADESALMFQRLLEQDKRLGKSDVQRSVEAFLSLVDRDGDGSITFDEFVEAIEDGLSLQVGEESRSSNSLASKNDKGHDILDVESTSLEDLSRDAMDAYVEWFSFHFQTISVEDLLAVSCFVAGVAAVSSILIEIEHTTLTC